MTYPSTITKAILDEDATQFSACLAAQPGSLWLPGKENPLHIAIAAQKYHWVEKQFMHNLAQSDTYISPQKQWEVLTQQAEDQYGRSAAFRQHQKAQQCNLEKQYDHAHTVWEQIRYYITLPLHKMRNTQIYIADKWFEKNQHTDKIQKNWIIKLGTPAMNAIKNVGIIATSGVLRYMMYLLYSAVPSMIKTPLIQFASAIATRIATRLGIDKKTAEASAPWLIENTVLFGLMPQYYVASSVLGMGVYYAFKDSGNDNWEAFATLIAETISSSIEMGSEQNAPIDERYSYHLHKNIKAVFGETLANIGTYIIPKVEALTQMGNIGVNYLAAPFKQGIEGLLSNMPSMPEMPSAYKLLVQYKNIISEYMSSCIERFALYWMGDSAFKRERLHALQNFEVLRLQYMGDTQALKAAIELEDKLFMETEGYTYFDTWQQKRIDLHYERVNFSATATTLQNAIAAEKEAYQQFMFYGHDVALKMGQSWAEHIDELFEKSKNNFFDSTTPDKLAEHIDAMVHNTFYHSADRSKMAIFCANLIIRHKYPLYPDMGDKVAIEAERKLYTDEIFEHELHGYERKKERAQDNLYDYIYAKLFNVEKKRHVHRHERILKPFVNEILGKTIGWIPYPDFKGGKIGRGENSPGVGLQFNHNVGGGQRPNATFTIANTAVLTVEKPNPSMHLSMPAQRLTENPAGSNPMPVPFIDTVSPTNIYVPTQPTPQTHPAYDLENPINANIVDEQYNMMFGREEEKEQEVRVKSTPQVQQTVTSPTVKQNTSEAAVVDNTETSKLHSNPIVKNNGGINLDFSVLNILGGIFSSIRGPRVGAYPAYTPRPRVGLVLDTAVLWVLGTAAAVLYSPIKNAVSNTVEWFEDRKKNKESDGEQNSKQEDQHKFPIFTKDYMPPHLINALNQSRENLENDKLTYPIHEENNTAYPGGNREDHYDQHNTLTFPIHELEKRYKTQTPINQPGSEIPNHTRFPALENFKEFNDPYQKKSKNVRFHAPDRDKKYVPAATSLPGFPDAYKVRGKTPYSKDKVRARWETSDDKILEWDYQHGNIEMYNKQGNHVGAYNHETGEKVEDAIKGRNIKKYL